MSIQTFCVLIVAAVPLGVFLGWYELLDKKSTNAEAWDKFVLEEKERAEKVKILTELKKQLGVQ